MFWGMFTVDMDTVLQRQPPDTWHSFPLFQILNDYLLTTRECPPLRDISTISNVYIQYYLVLQRCSAEARSTTTSAICSRRKSCATSTSWSPPSRSPFTRASRRRRGRRKGERDSTRCFVGQVTSLSAFRRRHLFAARSSLALSRDAVVLLCRCYKMIT